MFARPPRAPHTYTPSSRVNPKVAKELIQPQATSGPKPDFVQAQILACHKEGSLETHGPAAIAKAIEEVLDHKRPYAELKEYLQAASRKASIKAAVPLSALQQLLILQAYAVRNYQNNRHELLTPLVDALLTDLHSFDQSALTADEALRFAKLKEESQTLKKQLHIINLTSKQSFEDRLNRPFYYGRTAAEKLTALKELLAEISAKPFAKVKQLNGIFEKTRALYHEQLYLPALELALFVIETGERSLEKPSLDEIDTLAAFGYLFGLSLTAHVQRQGGKTQDGQVLQNFIFPLMARVAKLRYQSIQGPVCFGGILSLYAGFYEREKSWGSCFKAYHYAYLTALKAGDSEESRKVAETFMKAICVFHRRVSQQESLDQFTQRLQKIWQDAAVDSFPYKSVLPQPQTLTWFRGIYLCSVLEDQWEAGRILYPTAFEKVPVVLQEIEAVEKLKGAAAADWQLLRKGLKLLQAKTEWLLLCRKARRAVSFKLFAQARAHLESALSTYSDQVGSESLDSMRLYLVRVIFAQVIKMEAQGAAGHNLHQELEAAAKVLKEIAAQNPEAAKLLTTLKRYDIRLYFEQALKEAEQNPVHMVNLLHLMFLQLVLAQLFSAEKAQDSPLYKQMQAVFTLVEGSLAEQRQAQEPAKALLKTLEGLDPETLVQPFERRLFETLHRTFLPVPQGYNYYAFDANEIDVYENFKPITAAQAKMYQDSRVFEVREGTGREIDGKREPTYTMRERPRVNPKTQVREKYIDTCQRKYVEGLFTGPAKHSGDLEVTLTLPAAASSSSSAPPKKNSP